MNSINTMYVYKPTLYFYCLSLLMEVFPTRSNTNISYYNGYSERKSSKLILASNLQTATISKVNVKKYARYPRYITIQIILKIILANFLIAKFKSININHLPLKKTYHLTCLLNL